MPVDYGEVLKDLEEQEAHLLGRLKVIQVAKPAVRQLADEQREKLIAEAPKGRFAGMGPKGALRMIFAEKQELLTRDQLYEKLLEGGWTTEAKDPMSNVSASLSQLATAGEIEKVEDRWRKAHVVYISSTADFPSVDLERVRSIVQRQPSEQSHSAVQE